MDGTLKGYFVDLLDELSRVGNFNYTLTELPTSVPNGRNENNPTALTNELYRRVSCFHMHVNSHIYRIQDFFFG